LKQAAFRAGAAAMRSKEFLGHLEKDRSKAAARAAPASVGLDAGSVAWWMRYFGFAGPATRAAEAAPASVPGTSTKKSVRKPAASPAVAPPGRLPRPPQPPTGVPAPVPTWDASRRSGARVWQGMCP